MIKKHKSYWIDSTSETNYPALKNDYKTDVLIIGGGLAGIMLGYFLKEKGIDFSIVEMHRVGTGVTGYSTAKITSQHSLIYSELTKNFGKEKAALYADANQTAVRLYKEIIAKLDIDCDLKEMSNFVYANNEEDLERIQEEVVASSESGLNSIFSKCEGLPFVVQGAVETKGQARFHPLKYIQAIARYINKDKQRVFENTAVRASDYKNSPLKAMTDTGVITAKKIILATNYPFVDPDEFFIKLLPRQSYSIAADPGIEIPLGMYISTDKNFRSFRPHPIGGKECWIIGGEPQIVGREENTEQKYINLTDWAKEKFKITKIFNSWTTHDLKTFDSIPMVGKIDEKYPDVLIATGFKGWGITNTMASAKLLSDILLDVKNPWEQLYDPKRKSTIYSKELITYNAPTVARLLTENAKKYSNVYEGLKQEEGKILEIDGKKVAAYKDETGKLHKFDAHCMHMGCIVHFNKAEKSWDCPCHGSRYKIDGEIIHSPASKKLKEIKD